MATLTAVPAAIPQRRAITVHRFLVLLAAFASASLIVSIAIYGGAYYRAPLEDRALSPLHSQLRSSGTIGLRLGILSLVMFCILFLYPLRKRWRWLSTIGSTRRWLNFHVLFGISTPAVVTFHTAFRWHGIAGCAYWTMIAVALSGFVGRYVYAKIPRSVNAVELSIQELEAQTEALARRLNEQWLFRDEVLAPLFELPTPQQIRSMNFIHVLWTMVRLDIARQIHISRLRLCLLSGARCITTLGGLFASNDAGLEAVIANVRRQSRLRAGMAFLDRTGRVFHLWHAVHRPFSISFVVLILIHIGVALSVGF